MRQNGDAKKRMEREVWGSKRYYDILHKENLKNKHKSELILKEYAKKAYTILDLGCGEGSRLNILCGKKQKGVGIDISPLAIKLAKKNYPYLKFLKSDLENIPLESSLFDFVYAAYVIEHLTSPEKVISEAIRVAKPGGKILFVSPNFGSPNRASPPFKGSRIRKLVRGFFNDFFLKESNLNWLRVEPIAGKDKYESDWDTISEPYLGSLIRFMKSNGCKVLFKDSLWEEELKEAKLTQKIFRYLGERGFYPFSLWGPQLIIVCQKEK
ncbi:MAG TPA: methyltransferase domain-containing protein [Patescibacteria group bacterium]